MKHDRNSTMIGIGTSSLLMVMVVLCMTILATLSYLQVRHYDRQFTEKQRMITDYYGADRLAMKIYANIDEILYDEYKVKNASEYLEKCRQTLLERGYTVIDDQVFYEVEMNDKHSLKVILRILPHGSEHRLQIQEWKMVIKNLGDYKGTRFDT